MKTWNEIMNKMKSSGIVAMVTAYALGVILFFSGPVAKAFCPEYLIVWERIILLLQLYLCFCIVRIVIVSFPWLLGDIWTEIKKKIVALYKSTWPIDLYKKTWEQKNKENDNE